MRTILRVEHPYDGKGIWRSKDENECYRVLKLSRYIAFSQRHCKFSTPEHDNLPMDLEHFCAFKSIEEFQKWVNPTEIKEFINMGFKVLLIDVSTCFVGEFQIIFKKENILQTKDISNLFI